MSDKTQLPYPTSQPAVAPVKKRRHTIPFIALASILLLLGLHTSIFSISPFKSGCHPQAVHYTPEELKEAQCPVQPPTIKLGDGWNPLNDETYSALAAKRLSKAVQINTESFDNLPTNASDPLFDKHYAFSHFLETEYPKLFSEPIKHEYVNTHGHLFTWQGSNPSLKPIVLLAHIDTVPVLPATVDQWTYPPFEGKISVNASSSTPGTWIWGRGVSDCKNSVLGIYGSLERLVTEGFKPERTILVANGFDEEIGGTRGSGALAQVIQERYGRDSISFLIDEGFSGISYEYGATVASLGMAEKGSVNVKVVVKTLGGHSSVPPTHTGIGIISLLLSEIEKHPFRPSLEPKSPFLKYLTCLADLAPEIPKKLRSSIKNPKKWPALAKELAHADRKFNSFLATSTAIDLISGGVKVNALPEVVEATINHRIAFTSNVNATLEHYRKIVTPLAKSLNFTLSFFGEEPEYKSPFHIELDTGGFELEAAPITPSDSSSFRLIAGTNKAVFGDDTVNAPTGMFANTDTRHFWNLTSNLYRYTPAVVEENLNQHTVDERISLAGHLNTTRFYYQLIQNTIGYTD